MKSTGVISGPAAALTICKVWDAEYPWDIRVSKVVASLTAAGHKVHLTARNRRGEARVEELPDCTVHRLGNWGKAQGRLNALSQFPAFINPRWYSMIHRTARDTGADVILCRDLPLAPTSIAVARRLRIPVVVDIAENYPAMMQQRWDAGRANLADYAVRNPTLGRQVEKWVALRTDHLIAVVEESRDRLIALGADPRKVTVVGNTPPRDTAREERELASIKWNGITRLVYLGLLEEHRGIGVLLHAMRKCLDSGTAVELDLIGDGREMDRFQTLARSLEINAPQVRFHGRMENARARAMLLNSHVGIIPHLADECWSTTIPNKLFDYMAAGLAVLSSDAAPAKRVVEECESGVVYESRSPEDLARAISALSQPDQIIRAGKAGIRAIRRHYNWENDSELLLGAMAQATRRN